MAPPGGMLGEGELPLNKTLLSAYSGWNCLIHGQANPTAPSPVITVSKQQLLTLPKGGCECQTIKLYEEPSP